jgi:hypothetical protein
MEVPPAWLVACKQSGKHIVVHIGKYIDNIWFLVLAVSHDMPANSFIQIIHLSETNVCELRTLTMGQGNRLGG